MGGAKSYRLKCWLRWVEKGLKIFMCCILCILCVCMWSVYVSELTRQCWIDLSGNGTFFSSTCELENAFSVSICATLQNTRSFAGILYRNLPPKLHQNYTIFTIYMYIYALFKSACNCKALPRHARIPLLSLSLVFFLSAFSLLFLIDVVVVGWWWWWWCFT